MKTLKLRVMGSSSALPTPTRNLPAMLLERENESILFDCGDGTQLQLLRHGCKVSRISTICISHVHGDHIYGLFGLLSSIFFQNPDQGLVILGPASLDPVLALFRHLEPENSDRFTFITVAETGETCPYENQNFKIKAFPLKHRTTCFAYRFIESPRRGRLRVEALNAVGVNDGPTLGAIKSGNNVCLDDGRVIKSAEFVDPPQRGRSVVYCTDTLAFEEISTFARYSDLLICEATFAEPEHDNAIAYFHMTAKQAIALAEHAQAQHLLLTHFSSRYRVPEHLIQDLELPQQLKISLAKDGLEIVI